MDKMKAIIQNTLLTLAVVFTTLGSVPQVKIPGFDFQYTGDIGAPVLASEGGTVSFWEGVLCAAIGIAIAAIVLAITALVIAAGGWTAATVIAVAKSSGILAMFTSGVLGKFMLTSVAGAIVAAASGWGADAACRCLLDGG